MLGGARSNTNSHTSASSSPEDEAPTITAEPIIGKTEGLETTPRPLSSTDEAGQTAGLKKKGPPAYLDDRLFVCRATVMGVESEPMRVKEKTKRRQRHVKRVKSKHRYTVVRVKELVVRGLSGLEGNGELEHAGGEDAQGT